jgi:outer membrane protein
MQARHFVFAMLAAMLPAVAQNETLKLTLKEAEKLALDNNPQVSAARFAAEASKEAPKEIRSSYQPTVVGNVTGAGASDGARLAAGALNNPIIYDRLASGIGVSQLVTDFGRTRNLAGSAEFQSLAQQEVSKATRAEVLNSVDRAYYSLLRAEAVLKVAQETVRARKLVSDQVTSLAENRLKSSLDVSFANVNLAEAQLLLSTAQSDVRAASANLASAIGYPNQRSFVLADEDMPPMLPDDPRALIAEAIQNRPELAGLRYQQEAAARFSKAERSLSMPTVSTLANIGVVPTGATQLAGRYGAVGVNLAIPIFNGGLFAARRTEAALRERSAEEHTKDIQNRIVRDVQVAYLNATTGFERMTLTGKLLDQAKLAFTLAESRYQLGLSSIVELSQAQLNLTSAQIATTSAKYDYQTQWSTLQYQIGALR